jgi:hypothetical protein
VHGVRGADRDDVLVNMIPVHAVQMAVMKIVNVAVMANSRVPAVRAMLVGHGRDGASATFPRAHSRAPCPELAWLWQRYQPDSAQVSWFRERITAIRFARFFKTTSIQRRHSGFICHPVAGKFAPRNEVRVEELWVIRYPASVA